MLVETCFNLEDVIWQKIKFSCGSVVTFYKLVNKVVDFLLKPRFLSLFLPILDYF